MSACALGGDSVLVVAMHAIQSTRESYLQACPDEAPCTILRGHHSEHQGNLGLGSWWIWSTWCGWMLLVSIIKVYTIKSRGSGRVRRRAGLALRVAVHTLYDKFVYNIIKIGEQRVAGKTAWYKPAERATYDVC